MTRPLIVMLLAFSMGAAVGCADGKSNRRARIAAAGLQKQTPAGTDSGKDVSGGTQDGTTPATPAETPKDTTANTYDAAQAKSIQDKLTQMIADGEQINAEDLKDMTLDLDEITVAYTSLEDVESKNFVAAATFKYEAGGLKQTESVSTGSSTDVTLVGLSSLNHVAFAADGSTPDIDDGKTQATQLIPLVKSGKLTLAGQADDVSKASVLEEALQYLVRIKADADGKLISTETGALLNLVQIKKLDESISINVEVQIASNKIETFILKFKTTSSTTAQ